MPQPSNLLANGTRPLIHSRAIATRSSSHFGDFNATSYHLATSSQHLGSFPVQPDTLGCVFKSWLRNPLPGIVTDRKTMFFALGFIWLNRFAFIVQYIQPRFKRITGVDLFGSARISRKEPIATSIRGTTPRTVRWSELEPCRKWAPQVIASGTDHARKGR